MTRTVVAVYWRGDFRGRNYSGQWVRRLQRMVARHLSDYRFVCLSNENVPGVETLPLSGDLPGWWSKLELFRPDNGLTGRCLYIDLDSLVVGDLAPFFEHKGFVVAPPTSRWPGGQPLPDNPKITRRMSSFMMAFDAESHPELWLGWNEDVPKYFRGDQDYIAASVERFTMFPAQWFIKIRDCADGPNEGVRAIACNPWKNDVAARKFEWVRDIWC